MTLRDIRRFQRVEPDGYLSLSRRLAALGDAVSFRSAVDRAYYAAFLTAREELSGKGYGPFSSSSRAHTEVLEALRQLSGPASRRLRILRQARTALPTGLRQWIRPADNPWANCWIWRRASSTPPPSCRQRLRPRPV